MKKICISMTFDGLGLFQHLMVVDFLFRQNFLMLMHELFLDGEVLLVW
jgi:hypothetical protein